MAKGFYRVGDGVIQFSGTDIDALEFEVTPAPVQGILVSGATAGAFQVTINNVTLTINTGTANLAFYLPLKRAARHVGPVVVPTGGVVTVILDQIN